MNGTVVLTSEQFEAIDSAARHPLETAAVVLGVVHRVGQQTRFLATEIHWLADNAYVERRADELIVDSAGYVPALGAAEERSLTALWFHTHPGVTGRPRPSDRDQIVDTELEETFKIRTASDGYGTLIVSPRVNGLSFTGYLKYGGTSTSFDRMVVVGERIRVLINDHTTSAEPTTDHPDDDLFSRNIAAFGGGVQTALGTLRVGVVGAGGTGSSVGEQLIRLGVRNLLVADPDTLEESNVTRVYGSTPADVGKYKAELLVDHLGRIAPDADLSALTDSVNTESVARQFSACDVVFGCTDDNSGRMVLARIASFARVIVIDCGVQLSADAGAQLASIDGRITTMTPGSACLICRGRIDLPRAAAEQLNHEERVRLAGEGYAPELPGVQPAVVAFTTAVAAQAVMELLDLLIGFGPLPRPSEVLLRAHDREISTNVAQPRPGHFCDPTSGAVSAISDAPFLGKMWVR